MNTSKVNILMNEGMNEWINELMDSWKDREKKGE